MAVHERTQYDRQQPRLERDKIREASYVGRRLVEIAEEYPQALHHWQTRQDWLRAIAHDLELRANALDAQLGLF